jgi:predicted nucleic acid-binding protein
MRRCWRFGQRNPVNVDIITTEGQANVLQNLERKSEQARQMFEQLVQMMWQELKIEKRTESTKKVKVASWL